MISAKVTRKKESPAERCLGEYREKEGLPKSLRRTGMNLLSRLYSENAFIPTKNETAFAAVPLSYIFFEHG